MELTRMTEHVMAVVAGSLFLVAAAAADEGVYGRAGGPVGADAISQVARDARPAGTNSGGYAANVYGHAGQPVGAEAIEYVVKRARRSMAGDRQMDAYVGRAGGAIGVDRIRDGGTPRVAQARR